MKDKMDQIAAAFGWQTNLCTLEDVKSVPSERQPVNETRCDNPHASSLAEAKAFGKRLVELGSEAAA